MKRVALMSMVLTGALLVPTAGFAQIARGHVSDRR